MLAALVSWLLGWGVTLLTKLYNVFIHLLQYLIDCVPEFIKAVLELFSYACPPPPLPNGTDSVVGAMGAATWSHFIMTLNWLFPMQFLVYYVHMLICAMTAYLTLMVIGRWFKVTT